MSLGDLAGQEIDVRDPALRSPHGTGGGGMNYDVVVTDATFPDVDKEELRRVPPVRHSSGSTARCPTR